MKPYEKEIAFLAKSIENKRERKKIFSVSTDFSPKHIFASIFRNVYNMTSFVCHL